MEKFKDKLSTVAIVLMLIAGILIMLYPTISDYINTRNASRVIEDYNKKYSRMSEEEYRKYLEQYENYNDNLLLDDEVIFVNGEPEGSEYIQLDKESDHIMGYVEIEKIGVNLPIYFGTAEEILQKSVGHLEGSSLPCGGEGKHSVIVGHSGIANAKIFTDMDKVKVGDTFSITCFGKKMVYKVDKIMVVEPDDISSLQRVEGKDYVTLLTCTPYAVNTHRLLVRGIRIQ